MRLKEPLPLFKQVKWNTAAAWCIMLCRKSMQGRSSRRQPSRLNHRIRSKILKHGCTQQNTVCSSKPSASFYKAAKTKGRSCLRPDFIRLLFTSFCARKLRINKITSDLSSFIHAHVFVKNIDHYFGVNGVNDLIK